MKATRNIVFGVKRLLLQQRGGGHLIFKRQITPFLYVSVESFLIDMYDVEHVLERHACLIHVNQRKLRVIHPVVMCQERFDAARTTRKRSFLLLRSHHVM